MRINDLATLPQHVTKAVKNRGIFDGAEKTHPDLKKWFNAFQAKLEPLGVPIRIHSGYRGKDVQDALKAKGVSLASFGKSAHSFGLAVDVIHTTRAWNNMPKQGWSLLGALGHEVARSQNIKLEWGGEWDFYDPAHWQLADWRNHKDWAPMTPKTASDLWEELESLLTSKGILQNT